MKQVDPYEDLNVNAHGVLKPPLLLWLILFIETWHFWFLLFAVFSEQGWNISTFTSWVRLAVNAPALLILVALGARMPGASKIVRATWHKGRELLTVAALGSFGVVLFEALQDPFWRLYSDWTSLLVALLHVWVVVRVWMSPIIEKVFSEFPD